MGRAGRKLKAALDRFSDELDATLDRAVGDEAAAVVADEKRLVAVAEGTLRDSIDAVRWPMNAVVRPYGADVYYAIYIEFGRKHAPPQPFALPAAQIARRRWPDRAAKAVRKAAADAQR